MYHGMFPNCIARFEWSSAAASERVSWTTPISLGADYRPLEGFKIENPSKMMCNIFTLLVLYWCIKDREEGILCK